MWVDRVESRQVVIEAAAVRRTAGPGMLPPQRSPAAWPGPPRWPRCSSWLSASPSSPRWPRLLPCSSSPTTVPRWPGPPRLSPWAPWLEAEFLGQAGRAARSGAGRSGRTGTESSPPVTVPSTSGSAPSATAGPTPPPESAPAGSLLPPANPVYNIPPAPDFLWSCSEHAVDESTGCTDAALDAVDHARALEGLPPMVLPTQWAALTPARQLFVVTNLERTARGLAPLAGSPPRSTQPPRWVPPPATTPRPRPGSRSCTGVPTGRGRSATRSRSCTSGCTTTGPARPT